MKYAHVVIAGNNRLATFDFSLPVPGPAFVGTSVRADSVYPNQATEDVDLETLRTTLTRAPCCTTNSDKTRNGDPLNLVVVGSKSDPIVPFIARGWHVSQKLNVASTIETAHAFIYGMSTLRHRSAHSTFSVDERTWHCKKPDRQSAREFTLGYGLPRTHSSPAECGSVR